MLRMLQNITATACCTRTWSLPRCRCVQRTAAAIQRPPNRICHAGRNGTMGLPGWVKPGVPCRICTARAAAAAPDFAARRSQGSSSPAKRYSQSQHHRHHQHHQQQHQQHLRLWLQRSELIAKRQFHHDVTHQAISAGQSVTLFTRRKEVLRSDRWHLG